MTCKGVDAPLVDVGVGDVTEQDVPDADIGTLKAIPEGVCREMQVPGEFGT